MAQVNKVLAPPTVYPGLVLELDSVEVEWLFKLVGNQTGTVSYAIYHAIRTELDNYDIDYSF